MTTAPSSADPSSSSTQNPLTIAGASGAWGDSSLATRDILSNCTPDVLIYDGLAEITMGIVARQHRKRPELGYTLDIIEQIAASLPTIAQKGIKVITNSGGVNPKAAAAKLKQAAAALGLDVKIATVVGDNLLLLSATDQASLGLSAGTERGELICANAYLGAFPISQALAAGAQIVITGRAADSALALGPLIHHFGWAKTDFDLLAAGSLIGHLLECGPQACGGVATDWREMSSFEDIGYPIATCYADGSATVTKVPNRGGVVSQQALKEQLVYEIGDPERYLLPDVTCDFTRVTFEQRAADEVHVAGAVGRGPTETYKATVLRPGGYRIHGTLFLGGLEARAKACRLGADIQQRLERRLRSLGAAPLGHYNFRLFEGGGGAAQPGAAGATVHPGGFSEIALRLEAAHPDRRALGLAAREIPSFGLLAVGLGSGGGGVPKPIAVLHLENRLVPKALVDQHVSIELDATPVPAPSPEATPAAEQVTTAAQPDVAGAPPQASATHERPKQADKHALTASVDHAKARGRCTPLWELATARSGDKGSDANIGMVARTPKAYRRLTEELTAEAVAAHLGKLAGHKVERFELPGPQCLNFLLHGALGGGGAEGLGIDAQGKSLGQRLLDLRLGAGKPPAESPHPGSET